MPGEEFKKGGKGGPGRPRVPQEVKVVRRIMVGDVAEVATMALEGNVESLRQIAKSVNSPNSPYTVLQVAFAICLLKAISKGDVYALNAVLDRVVGKVKAEITVSGPGGGPIALANLSDDQLRQRYEEARQRILGGN